MHIAAALGLLAVLLLILLAAFFVAAEFSFVTVNRTRVEQRAAEGSTAARAVVRILHRLAFFLSGTQLGVTVSGLVLGAIAEPAIAGVLPSWLGNGGKLAVSLVIATTASMVFSELIPKNVAIARAEGTSLALGRPMLVYAAVFGPVIRFFNFAANTAVKAVGIEPREELVSVRTLEELELLIQSSGEEGTLDEESFALLQRAIRFEDKTAADALVARLSVVYVRPEDTLTALVERAATTGFSRFPVCGTDLDDVLGVVHVKDVCRVPVGQRAAENVRTIMAEPFIVPESRELASLLADLRTRSPLAVVVDEYGGTAGIITLEDVLEELVGDISDEYDQPAPLTAVLPAGTYELPGTLHPDEVLDACGFEIPEGEYETLAGFVLDRLGRIPDVGDRVASQGWILEVVAMDRRRIATVRLTAPDRNGTGARP